MTSESQSRSINRQLIKDLAISSRFRAALGRKTKLINRSAKAIQEGYRSSCRLTKNCEAANQRRGKPGKCKATFKKLAEIEQSMYMTRAGTLAILRKTFCCKRMKAWIRLRPIVLS